MMTEREEMRTLEIEVDKDTAVVAGQVIKRPDWLARSQWMVQLEALKKFNEGELK